MTDQEQNTLTGKLLIGGEWHSTQTSFTNSPTQGAPDRFFEAGLAEVDLACDLAEAAFKIYGYSTAENRAEFLNAIADEIEARGPRLTAVGSRETGLPEARLDGERGRTTGQLRLFAHHILKGDYLDLRHDQALPDRAPLPRPDLRMVQRPIGPVAVFGASNFPLAFSTAGGDTAAALAAGCPVIVKGHPAHPGTGEIVAEAILAAIKATHQHPGVFALLQSSEVTAAQALVQHSRIQAVGFTGSLRAGRALFDLCAARPVPIPFFGELGSINPVLLMPDAAATRGEKIAADWAASLTMGAGQFCTNPGLVLTVAGAASDTFVAAAKAALEPMASQTMLTDGIAAAYQAGTAEMSKANGVTTRLAPDAQGRAAGPALFETTAANWLSNPELAEEVFGPSGIVVACRDLDDMQTVLEAMPGQLTCTLQMTDKDIEAAQGFMPMLERKAGRVLANGFPTGVEVADSMVHGGPYPASTNFGATSVGTLAIRRFLRPVCYQNLPVALLPKETQA